MSKKGYNYAFKMYMEGVNVPFKGATIVCTPNGVEMNVNVFPNRELLDIKPKTAIQVFYREWHSNLKEPPWRLMGEGFFSSYYVTDQAEQGRGIALVCRDFRMDIRRAPAALAWEAAQDLTTQTFYNSMGIFRTFVVKGVRKNAGTNIRIFDNTGLAPLSYTLGLIAGTAGYGKNKGKNVKQKTKSEKTSTETTAFVKPDLSKAADLMPNIAFALNQKKENEEQKERLAKQKQGETAYEKEFASATPTDNGVARCGFYLDAIIRGMWTEAVGGTSVGVFLNKRIRMDKHFLVPVNVSGYNFWNRQKGSVHIGSHLMGNARFSSLEAAIMRLAGAFSTRVYSCSTPSLIPLGDDNKGNPHPAVEHVIDKDVRKFLIDRASAEFGAKFTLNSSMLLPPFEFTAPPNCNLLLPPMYDRVEWRYDMDVDVTRGYFSQTHMLTTHGSTALSSPSVQVPNALFNIGKTQKAKDLYGRRKPPLTLEERYKGVNVIFGSVSYELAANDARAVLRERQLLNKKIEKYDEEKDKIHTEIDNYETAKNGTMDKKWYEEKKKNPLLTAVEAESGKPQEDLKKKHEDVVKEQRKARQKKSSVEKRTTNALKHHAVLKFLNAKFQGRVVTVDGAFNPYIMCGFPGAVIADDLGRGGESMKTILGMVQQVRHTIFITPGGAEANTSIVMNNARFEDEPTDIDEWGSPLYMKATIPEKAEIDPTTLKYKNSKYAIPEPKPPVAIIRDSKYYDLDDKTQQEPGYEYAKDLLSLTKDDIKNGERNQIYIDEKYEPTKIASFYRDVFGHTANHFMVGVVPDKRQNANENGKIYFMYDTIHEAIKKLRTNQRELLTDYDAALNFVKRNVCSADAYFQGILGLSISESGEDGLKFTNIQDGFNDSRIKDNYFGVSTADWEANKSNIAGLKYYQGGEMFGPGEFSSIREHTPVTAFIKERRDAVELYLAKARREAVGLTYQEKY